MESSRPATILIVDDDAGMRSLLEVLLENAGFATLSAHDGGSAQRILSEHSDAVDACLLDLNLDDCQGEDLYDKLIQLKPGLAVFPMSGLYGEEIAERFEGRKISGVVPKPFMARQLLDILEEGLNRKLT